jgi:hypothetical protein
MPYQLELDQVGFFMDKDGRNSLHDEGMKAFLALCRLISKN